MSVPFAGYLMALLSLPVGVLFLLGLAATLLAIAWLLESLESDTERVLVRVAPDASRGEPIAARSGGSRPLGLASRTLLSASAATAGPSGMSSFGAVARPTVPEQLARSRDLRARRGRWLVDRQHHRPLD